MINPVKTKKDYEGALQRCYDLMQKNIKPHTPEADELEILSILVENYEQKYFPIPLSNPLEAIM
ncbi:MAG: hypothetical protein ABI168_12480 [Ginsengibacter sp.]